MISDEEINDMIGDIDTTKEIPMDKREQTAALYSEGVRLGQGANSEEEALLALAQRLIDLGYRENIENDLDPNDPEELTMIKAFAIYDAQHKQK